ncbi:MAG: hypothetical protein Q9219_003442 [cf. Caloplaca sp. 3 TL-2023]
MRGLSKAAALLSSVYSAVASSVEGSILDGQGNGPDYVIKYNESEASVVFRVSEPIAPGLAIPPLKFLVGSTKEPCGDSNIRLNSQSLSTEWDENHGLGSDFLEAFRFLPNIFTTWHIDCLYEDGSSVRELADGKDPVQVARFGIYNHNKGRTEAAGFAVSFRSTRKPEILRLVPVWTDNSDILNHPDIWRTPSLPATPGHTRPDEAEHGTDTIKQEPPIKYQQTSLSAHLKNLQATLGTTYQRARKTFESWCSTTKHNALESTHNDAPSPIQDPITTTSTIGASGTNPHALPTRSASPEAATTNSVSDSSPHTGVKIFGLVLILSSLIVWVILRLRDPRVRADRAARREERRNKRLYARAARQHKWKRWFCSWRHRNHRCTPVSTWDEKRARVVEQEEVLEEVMKSGIRRLRNAQRVGGSINAAEQGRSIYVYDSDDSRRRSRETLPGYESEGTQPPSYETDVECEITGVADGFRCILADRDYSPDSSVISTSPRTSRDDRSSIFEKDIEPLSLGSAVVEV